jgi:hypothetical protein
VTIEPFDSDNNGDSNLDEINANAQPGWTEGENNTIYYKNGSTVPGQLPPSITSLDPGTCTDADNDTYYAESGCGTPVDCNDSDPAINPGAVEDCTDGIDNDCDNLIDTQDPDAVNCPVCTDADNDTYYAESGCGTAVDCDDTDPAINPGAVEDCTDGIDNDCDNLIDTQDPDAVNCPSCTDDDNDTYAIEGGSCGPVDCDDTDPAINPGAEEDCSDTLDNDCDGLTDVDDPDCAVEICDDGIDNDGDGKTDCDDKKDCNQDPACAGGGGQEICTDGIDNDGDGKIDCADKKDCGRDPAC